MKSQQTAFASPRACPRLVSLGRARNIRWLIEIGDKPAPSRTGMAHAFHGILADHDDRDDTFMFCFRAGPALTGAVSANSFYVFSRF